MIGVLFVVLASLLWAADTLIRYPLLSTGISAEQIVFTEHLFLTLFFAPILFQNRLAIWQSRISSFFYFCIIGFLGSAIATLCFTKAFSLLNPSLVILLQKFQPIVSISLASLVLKENVKKEFLIWALLALLGGLLISSPDILPGLSQLNLKIGLLNQSAVLGYVLTLVAVVSWGASTVFGKKLTLQGFNEQQIMGGRFTFGFVFLAFYSWSNKNLINLDVKAIVWGKIFAMVLISGLLGMYFYYKGLKSISARVCALSEMFFPLSAVLINWIFLGVTLTTVQVIGACLLVLSSAIIQFKHY